MYIPAQPLEILVGERLRRLQLKLALAESCTGGLLSHLITNVPGASDYYLGGVTAYSNVAKIDLLGVKQSTLDCAGTVSEESVIQMASGIRRVFSSAYPAERIVGLSISGIAGPDGGSVEKPIGLVWIGLCSSSGEAAYHHRFSGNRRAIKTQSAQTALTHLLTWLEQLETYIHTE
ncbi:MAG: CinA family protein [Anaerolineaceae bacterium]|nr:CinA family protein [Anaerolineaceae bacterium]